MASTSFSTWSYAGMNANYSVTTLEPFYGNATTVPYQKPFGVWVTVLSGVILFIFMIIGIALNSLTIAVIKCTKSLRSNFMYFIISLCASDLMSALISPLFWYRRTLGFDVWMPPNFFCKLFWSVDLMTSFSTSLHILNFAILRFISIQYPSLFRNISQRTGKIWIAITWFIAFMCGFIPMWVFTGADPGVRRDRTTGEKNAKWPACTLLLDTLPQYGMYTKVGFSIFLLLPMVVVIVFSSIIVKSVHDHSANSILTNDVTIKRRLRKEKQAVLQLFLIVFSFLFGYVPFVAYETWSLFDTDPVSDYWFGLLQYFFLRLSECLNPVFYNISSSKMRRHTKKFLESKCKCCLVFTSSSKPASAAKHSSMTTTLDPENTQMGV